MDALSLGGLLLALAAIAGGHFLEGGQLAVLANGPAALIVLGGTLGAVMLQTPLVVFRRALRMAPWVLRPPRIDLAAGIERVIRWSQIARRDGLLGLEPLAEAEADPYARKGLQLLADGLEPALIRSVLEVELYGQEGRDLRAARVFDSMGGYAPTIGILGAVMGLIQVMGNLTEPGRLGEGIAVAFVATLYGVGAANLLLLPVGSKLKALVQRRTAYRELLLEGLMSIAAGESPRATEYRLQGFLD